MIVRTLTEKDVESVTIVFREVFSLPPYNESWSVNRAEKLLKQSLEQGREFNLFVTETDTVVGFLLSRLEVWDDGDHVFVTNIGISPSFQGKGVGSLLVDELEKRSREQHIKKICLGTLENDRAFSFWTKLGYKKNGFVDLEKTL